MLFAQKKREKIEHENRASEMKILLFIETDKDLILFIYVESSTQKNNFIERTR
jgi:hypothetical protein